MKPHIGFALTGSFCTFRKAIDALAQLTEDYSVTPILSAAAYETDSRFGPAAQFRQEIETLCGTEILHTLPEVEPLGPKKLMYLVLVCAWCC